MLSGNSLWISYFSLSFGYWELSVFKQLFYLQQAQRTWGLQSVFKILRACDWHCHKMAAIMGGDGWYSDHPSPPHFLRGKLITFLSERLSSLPRDALPPLYVVFLSKQMPSVLYKHWPATTHYIYIIRMLIKSCGGQRHSYQWRWSK